MLTVKHYKAATPFLQKQGKVGYDSGEFLKIFTFQTIYNKLTVIVTRKRHLMKVYVLQIVLAVDRVLYIQK